MVWYCVLKIRNERGKKTPAIIEGQNLQGWDVFEGLGGERDGLILRFGYTQWKRKKLQILLKVKFHRACLFLKDWGGGEMVPLFASQIWYSCFVGSSVVQWEALEGLKLSHEIVLKYGGGAGLILRFGNP